MAFDRSKFKPTNMKAVEKVTQEASKTMPVSSGSREWVAFYDPKEGKNVYRVLPSVTGIPYMPLKTANLTCEVPVYEDGKKTGIEIKSKSVFCADVHGKELLGGKCPIMLYISCVEKKMADIQDADERRKKLLPVYGFRDKQGKWQFGISPMLSYVCYVEMEDDVWKLKLRPKWLKDMQDFSVKQSEDDSLSIDVFSSLEDGYPLIITKDKDDKGNWVYSVDGGVPRRGQSWDDFFNQYVPSDAILEKLEGLPTLEDLYDNVYSRKDFDMAVDGLSRFDSKYGFGVFQDDEFLDQLEEMEKMLPEEGAEEEKKGPSTKKEGIKPTTKREVTKDSEQAPENTGTKRTIAKPEAASKAADNKTYPTMIAMKKFLRSYITENYGDDEQLPTNLSLNELRDWYDLAQAGDELPFDEHSAARTADLPFEDDEKPDDTAGGAGSSDDSNGLDDEAADNPVDTSAVEERNKRLAAAKARISKIRK